MRIETDRNEQDFFPGKISIEKNLDAESRDYQVFDLQTR